MILKKSRPISKILQRNILVDNPHDLKYPINELATGTDEVYVGRIRKDTSCKNTINMWIVADNIRKGAASNAVQILEKLISNI